MLKRFSGMMLRSYNYFRKCGAQTAIQFRQYVVVRNMLSNCPRPALPLQIPAMKDTAGGKGSIIFNTSVTGLRPLALPGVAGAGSTVGARHPARQHVR